MDHLRKIDRFKRDVFHYKGVTLVEIVAVIAIISILAGIYLYYEQRYRYIYLFKQYSLELLSITRRAKLTAMERSTNTGVCLQTHEVILYYTGPQRGAGICSGSPIGRVRIRKSEQNHFSFAGSGFSFDPRGFAIFYGNVCLYSPRLNAYYLICVSRFGGIRDERGSGQCPSRCE